VRADEHAWRRPGGHLARNYWARINNVVNDQFEVRRDSQARFIQMADLLRSQTDNAFDGRAWEQGTRPVQWVRQARQLDLALA